MKRSRRRRWWRRIAVGLAVAACLALLGTWLALRHVPSWYHPVQVPDRELQRVRDSLTAVFREVSDSLVAGEPFEVTLDDRTVSEWIAARGQIWPDSQEWVPAYLREPVVVFVPGKAVLAAHLEQSGWESIVGLRFSATADNGAVVVRLEDVTCGALPLPLAALREPLDKLIHAERLDIAAMPDELGSIMGKLRGGEGTALFGDGIRFRGPFVWKNGDRPYHIGRIQIGDGWLRVRIDPL
ncbi:MAG: hypothetical protein ACYSUI_12045 [Planctomycetota bacterium]|jgi:hypothetical protein